MKQHLVSGAVAAVIAAVVAIGANHYGPPKPDRIYTYMAFGNPHRWPGLSDGERKAFTEIAKTFPKTAKFDIVCNDGNCSDLAADIDDAFEDAGIDSVLDKAIGPLGYGIGVQVNEFDKDVAVTAAAAVNKATDGRLDPKIVTGSSPPGYVTILIGKRPRS